MGGGRQPGARHLDWATRNVRHARRLSLTTHRKHPPCSGKGGRCALLCHYCRHHLEAEDDEALLGVVRTHLIQEPPTILPTDEQVSEIVATRRAYYYLEFLPVHVGGTAFEEEEFDPDPY